MTRLAKSTAAKMANKKGGRSKAAQKLPQVRKPIHHRRNLAGCVACRIRGKKCDQQQLYDGGGFSTCLWCYKHGVPCTGGFGVKSSKLPGLVGTERGRELFRIRIKLYMGETGQARGIRGWTRSGPLRQTRLSRAEVEGYISSHYYLPEEESDHYDCIYFPNGVCYLAQHLAVPFAHSPSSFTDSSSDSGSPTLSQGDITWSPQISGGEFDAELQSPPTLIDEVSALSIQLSGQLNLSSFDNVIDPGLLVPVGEEVGGSCECPSDVDVSEAEGAFLEFAQAVIASELL